MLISDNEDNYYHKVSVVTTFPDGQKVPIKIWLSVAFSKCLHENKATLCTMMWEVRALKLWLHGGLPCTHVNEWRKMSYYKAQIKCVKQLHRLGTKLVHGCSSTQLQLTACYRYS